MVHILHFRFYEKCKTVRIAGVTMSQVWNYYEKGRAENGCKLGKCRTCENIMRAAEALTLGLADGAAELHGEGQQVLHSQGEGRQGC